VISIVGILVVFGSVLGGFLMAGGHLIVLLQPSEYVVIGGAALGSILIANGPSVIKATMTQLSGLPKSGPSKKDYLDLLVMSFQLLSVARRDGVMALESHIENPEESSIISQYPSFTRNHHAVHFLTDTMRLMISGSDIAPHDLDAMLDIDMEVQHHEHGKPSRMLQVVGDALPGLGIVAAVLGIVITMGHIDGPPEEIGHHVGAALVGTFLGVLLSYGFVQPLSANLANKADEDQVYFQALKQILLAFHKGSLATTAVEFARRSLPSTVRPEFAELEDACRAARAGVANAA
jgi:chemotaxis protein MotA